MQAKLYVQLIQLSARLILGTRLVNPTACPSAALYVVYLWLNYQTLVDLIATSSWDPLSAYIVGGSSDPNIHGTHIYKQ